MGGYDKLRSFRRLDQESGEIWQDVGMQAQFRFFNTDQGRLLWVAEDNQKAEKAKGSIGKASGRDGLIQVFFVKINLDGAAMNFRADIIEFVIK